jgi:hypothetical protein
MKQITNLGRREVISASLAFGLVPSAAWAQSEQPLGDLTQSPNAVSTRPGANNTGYENAPGYPGRLTLHNGAPLVAGREYRFINFPRGVTVSVAGVKFFGCRFASNWVDGWNVRLAQNGAAPVFRFCTIEPSAISAPPNAAWPSAGAGKNKNGGNVAGYMIGHTLGYQYGILQASGGLLIEDSDIWGFSNAIVLNGSAQKTIRRCWIHDAAHEGIGSGMYHQDGPGHLDGYGCSNVLIEDCTIASLGNTNGIAFQAGTYSKIVVRRNYLSGFGYCIDMCHGTYANSYLTFEDNVIATDIGWIWGPLYIDFSANFRKVGSSWKRNKLRVMPGTVPAPASNRKYTAADNGKFVHPNGAYSLTDWT